MNILEYFTEKKRLNILNKELEESNNRLVKINSRMYYSLSYEAPAYLKLIEVEMKVKNKLIEDISQLKSHK